MAYVWVCGWEIWCFSWDMTYSNISVHIALYQCTNMARNEAGKLRQEDPLEELKENHFPPTSKYNPLLIHNVLNWSDVLWKSCSICYKIFKICRTTMARCALRSVWGCSPQNWKFLRISHLDVSLYKLC